MTDLEAHVAREGRADMVRQVRAKIDELGTTFVYYQFVSVTGRIVGKGVPVCCLYNCDSFHTQVRFFIIPQVH